MKTNQSWGGRFAEGPKEAVARYTDSQTYDRALYAQDIRASRAHARMLGRQGVITPEEAQILADGLDRVRAEIESGGFVWKPELEDVHMNIEARLTELTGDVGKKLHTGRSRNDQVGLSFRLFVADRLDIWRQRAAALCAVLVKRAAEHQGDILPGCTHLQPAQPVSLAQHLLAYAWMFRRDALRLTDTLKRVRISPLGAAALAGTTYPLDPQSVADEVGFAEIYGNSMDAVSDRDFVLEALFDGSAAMMHLSRLCEEIILWANPAFGFVKLPDGYATARATETLAKEGFTVLPYINADLYVARDLVNAGAAAVMPLGAPIGTNRGLRTREMIAILIEELDLPVVVDAGIGRPSQACEAMEMGAAACLVNTAIASSDDPVRMAGAFRAAVEAGRNAWLAGAGAVMARGEGAEASSPLTGFLR